jgi:DNA-directed RNA polymerase specialized sigma24 family protein
MPRDLDSGAFQALLDALQQSGADAGSAYEQLRLKLIRFFRWNNCGAAEELADMAMDRLAERLAQNFEAIKEPGRFVLGIARMLVHESRAREKRETKAVTEFAAASARSGPREDGEQGRLESLELCLGKLPQLSRILLERYYTGDAGERIRNRQRLAAELGLDLNAVRNRALRLRRQLEVCVERELRAQVRRDTSARIDTGMDEAHQ